MSKNITLRLAARTDVGRERDHNEDNFIVCPDLSLSEWSFDNTKAVKPGIYGTLLVVADGMGGTNAGEVASQIAVESVQEFFVSLFHQSPQLSEGGLKSKIKEAIIHASTSIVNWQKHDKETEGMGSTLIIAWIVGNKLYCGWSGDSRCYIYNSSISSDEQRFGMLVGNGRLSGNLMMVSKDHSYVQTLVDKGKLTYDQAFFHPEGNIVTQSLGDAKHPPKPDVIAVDLRRNDRIILCSDGLNGMLEDAQIERITGNLDGINECTQALVDEANKAGGHDNITVLLADIVEGGIPVGEADEPNVSSLRTKFNTYYPWGIIVVLFALLMWSTLFRPTSNDKQGYMSYTLKGDVIVSDESGNSSKLSSGDTVYRLKTYSVARSTETKPLKNVIDSVDSDSVRKVDTLGTKIVDPEPQENEPEPIEDKEVPQEVEEPNPVEEEEVLTIKNDLEALDSLTKALDIDQVRTPVGSDLGQNLVELKESIEMLLIRDSINTQDSVLICSSLNNLLESVRKLDNQRPSAFDENIDRLDKIKMRLCRELDNPAVTGGTITPIENNLSNEIEFDTVKSFNLELAAAERGGLWGYINRDNEVIIDFEYDYALNFSISDSLAGVKKGGKWGFIDIEGVLRIEYKFDLAVSQFARDTAKVVLEGDTLIINKKGEILGNS